jgi:hypothetical protein
MNKGFVSGLLVAMAVSGDVSAQDQRCVEQVNFTPVDPCQIPECSDEMQHCKDPIEPKEEPETLCRVYNGLICNIS